MDRGFIRLWRKTEDSEIFADDALFKMACWAAMRATWKPRWVVWQKGCVQYRVFLKVGQFIFGRQSAAEALGWPETTTYKRLRRLERMNFVELDARDKHYTVVSVCNYELYNSNHDIEGRTRVARGTSAEESAQPQNDESNVAIKRLERLGISP